MDQGKRIEDATYLLNYNDRLTDNPYTAKVAEELKQMAKDLDIRVVLAERTPAPNTTTEFWLEHNEIKPGPFEIIASGNTGQSRYVHIVKGRETDTTAKFELSYAFMGEENTVKNDPSD